MFPGLIHVHQGDPRLNPAHNVYEYAVTDVKPNAPVTTMPVPDVVRNAKVEPAKVQSTRLADRLWLLGGGSHNSVLVEFNDFVAVVEAPQNEERSLAVMDEVARLTPNKPIKYLVNTHNHFDHSSGLRRFMAEGATIITYEGNKQYYEKLATLPHTLNPDKLAQSKRKPSFETMTEQKTLTDGNHVIQSQRVAVDDDLGGHAPKLASAPPSGRARHPRELGVAGRALIRPVDHGIVRSDIVHTHRAVMRPVGLVEAEHIGEARQRLNGGGSEAARRRPVDHGEVAHGAGSVQRHRDGGASGRQPQRAVGVPLDAEIEVGA